MDHRGCKYVGFLANGYGVLSLNLALLDVVSGSIWSRREKVEMYSMCVVVQSHLLGVSEYNVLVWQSSLMAFKH